MIYIICITFYIIITSSDFSHVYIILFLYCSYLIDIPYLRSNSTVTTPTTVNKKNRANKKASSTTSSYSATTTAGSSDRNTTNNNDSMMVKSHDLIAGFVARHRAPNNDATYRQFVDDEAGPADDDDDDNDNVGGVASYSSSEDEFGESADADGHMTSSEVTANPLTTQDAFADAPMIFRNCANAGESSTDTKPKPLPPPQPHHRSAETSRTAEADDSNPFATHLQPKLRDVFGAAPFTTSTTSSTSATPGGHQRNSRQPKHSPVDGRLRPCTTSASVDSCPFKSDDRLFSVDLLTPAAFACSTTISSYHYDLLNAPPFVAGNAPDAAPSHAAPTHTAPTSKPPVNESFSNHAFDGEISFDPYDPNTLMS